MGRSSSKSSSFSSSTKSGSRQSSKSSPKSSTSYSDYTTELQSRLDELENMKDDINKYVYLTNLIEELEKEKEALKANIMRSDNNFYDNDNMPRGL